MATITNSNQLAKLWATLLDLKTNIDNVAVPLGTHLSLDDPNLMIALEDLSERIGVHFEEFKLQAVRIPRSKRS